MTHNINGVNVAHCSLQSQGSCSDNKLDFGNIEDGSGIMHRFQNND